MLFSQKTVFRGSVFEDFAFGIERWKDEVNTGGGLDHGCPATFLEEPVKYQPSNGTEGEEFLARWCEQCRFFESPCKISFNTMVYEIEDPEYPEEWTYGEDDKPCCTAWDRGELDEGVLA